MPHVRKVIVTTRDGLHARPCAAIVKRVRKGKATLRLSHGDAHADGTSVLHLMLLEVSKGSEVSIETDGPDAEALAAEVERILTSDS